MYRLPFSILGMVFTHVANKLVELDTLIVAYERIRTSLPQSWVSIGSIWVSIAGLVCGMSCEWGHFFRQDIEMISLT